tara:strand:+ start:170 stop:508 length:339 start_codon:yes stop_codon:yes gene_type:complete
MAIIHTYPRKPLPKKEDLILISDDSSNNPKFKTKSATLESLSDIGLDKNFVFTQSVPAIEWTINHNLNKYCSVTVVDSGLPPNVVIGDVSYTNKNTVVVTFTAAFSGQAYLN